MEWIKSLNEAIDYIEDNITDKIRCEDVAEHIYLSRDNNVSEIWIPVTKK